MAKTVLLIEGMMCEICEGVIADALKKVDGVTEAVTDFKKGTAEVTHNGVKDEDLIRAVVEAGLKARVKKSLFKRA